MNLDINKNTFDNIENNENITIKNMSMEDKIKNDPNAILYDPVGGMENSQIEINNLPNVQELLMEITKILEYICKDDIIKMKHSDFKEYELHMESKFEKFSMRYYGIFQKLINGEDITPLMSMFDSINKIKSGYATVEQEEKRIGEELADRYIYPNLTKSQRKKVKKTLKEKTFLK